jgi:hypothetical protein
MRKRAVTAAWAKAILPKVAMGTSLATTISPTNDAAAEMISPAVSAEY